MAFQSLHCLLLLLILFPLAGKSNASATVPAIIVFGDSSVDAGNNNEIPTIAKSNFQPYGRDFEGGKPTGRFCNGRLATDFISGAFGIKPTIPAYLDPASSIKDFATGVCFASAGSGYDNATSDVLSVIPLWKELEYFKEYQKKLRSYVGKDMANKILGEALYMLSVGTNDFLENYFSNQGNRSSQFTIEEYENFLINLAEGFITKLYMLGARKISIGGLPPMGCLPLERTLNFGECREDYNILARDFNWKLKMLQAKLSKKLGGIRLVFSNIYDPFLQIIDKPLLYGFEDVERGCCGTGRFEMGFVCNPAYTCTDANKFGFWDSFHPTERMNLILADRLMKTSLAEFI